MVLLGANNNAVRTMIVLALEAEASETSRPALWWAGNPCADQEGVCEMRKKKSSIVRRRAHPKMKPIVIRPDGTIAPEEFTGEEELEFFQGWDLSRP